MGETIAADFVVPDSAALEAALSVTLDASSPVRVVARRASPWQSAFPAEAVTCETAGRELRLWCKYADGRIIGGVEAHRRLAYEASVYQEVLRGTPVPTLRCHGFYRDSGEGWTCLVLERLDKSMPVSKAMALEQAGEWLGTFHAWTEAKVLPAWLRVFDAAYYERMVLRIERLSVRWHRQYPVLADLGRRAAPLLAALESSPQVLVHGEFFPLNVLVQEGVVLPVDWESAGVGAGEIDLAALVEGWEKSPLWKAAEGAYVQARWGGVAPRHFERCLYSARIYGSIRQLGWVVEPTPAKPVPERRIHRTIDTFLGLLTDWPSG